MKIRFIGDTHFKYSEFLSLVDHNIPCFHVGDCGIMGKYKGEKLLYNLPLNTKAVFGNHDNPKEIEKYKFFLPRYGYIPEYSILYIGGANTPHHTRCKLQKIQSWWPEEELTQDEFSKAIELYIKEKPRILLTHDAPEFLRRRWFNVKQMTRTSMNLNVIAHLSHRVEHHIFGHFHKKRQEKINSTIYRCIEECGIFDLEI